MNLIFILLSFFLLWDSPDKSADGTQLKDLAGFKVYYGSTSGNYGSDVDVGMVNKFGLDFFDDGENHYFVVTAYDTAGNESEFSEEIFFNPNPAPEKNIAIYPNPIRNIVRIISEGMVRIYNVKGQEVAHMKIEGEYGFDMSGYSAGKYFFVLERGGKTFKIIKGTKL